MRLLLSVILFGGVAGTAIAADYDSRLYVSPSVGYLITDPGRGVDDDFSYGLTAGLPVSETQNYELSVGYADLDSNSLINLNANLLTFFDPNLPSLFSILSAGVLYSDGGPGTDYFSPNVAVGLGALLPGWFGKFRLEALLRGDLHYNESAGLGGKKAFVEPLIRLGYSIPLGPEPSASAPAYAGVNVVDSDADSDNDGVADSTDVCPGTPLGTVVDATGCATTGSTAPVQPAGDCRPPVLDESVDQYGCAVDRSVVLNGVNFEFDSDVLTRAAEVILDDVAQVLAGMPGTPVEIAGHTSDEGDQYYNIDLSQRRADAVRRYLIAAGIPASQLMAKGYGGNAPVNQNDTAKGRRGNRRVEIKVVR